jgi:CheY-like chemotaxis protein
MPASSPTVLAIDDNRAFNYAICRALEQNGYRCLHAHTGEEALQMAFAHVPDAILLDVNLPDLTGFEVCRRLKADPRTKAIPVVFLSAAQNTAHAKETGRAVGADGFLFAPVETSQLLTVIHGAMVRASHASVANPRPS